MTALGDVALGQIYLEAELGGAEVLATVAPLGAALVGSLILVSQPAGQASPGHSYGSLSAQSISCSYTLYSYDPS